MTQTAKETIIQASRGDWAAFQEIYKAHFQFVANVAYRVVNNLEDAQEVAQEVFVTVYRKLAQFRFDSSLKTWIYRITVNTAINYAKKAPREHKNGVEYEDIWGAKESVEIKELVDGEYRENVLNSLLGALNPDQRACIVLRSVEGLSYEEIAATLQIPINTVRTRIKRARETMMALRKEVMNNEL